MSSQQSHATDACDVSQHPLLRATSSAVASLSAFLLAYVVAYFAVLALPATVRLPGTSYYDYVEPLSGAIIRLPTERTADYHGLPSRVFAPLHFLDVHYFRPSFWVAPPITPFRYPTTNAK